MTKRGADPNVWVESICRREQYRSLSTRTCSGSQSDIRIFEEGLTHENHRCGASDCWSRLSCRGEDVASMISQLRCARAIGVRTDAELTAVAERQAADGRARGWITTWLARLRIESPRAVARRARTSGSTKTGRDHPTGSLGGHTQSLAL